MDILVEHLQVQISSNDDAKISIDAVLDQKSVEDWKQRDRLRAMEIQ